MDGDTTAKTLDTGANSAIRNVEGSDSMHETSHQATPAGGKTKGTGTPAFSKDGAIGSMFRADGAIGGTAEKVGGPFSRDGVVGVREKAKDYYWVERLLEEFPNVV